MNQTAVAIPVLPHNIEAEVAILGTMMIDNEAIVLAQSCLEEVHFYRKANQIIFNSICRVYDQTGVCDLILTSRDLTTHGQLEIVGGNKYLSKLLDYGDISTKTIAHANILLATFQQRTFYRRSMKIANAAIENDTEEMDRQVGKFQDDIADTSIETDEVESWSKTIPDMVKHYENGVNYFKAGFSFLEIEQGNIVTIAGLPSMGKTSLACNIARALANSGKVVVFFSLEADKKSLSVTLYAQQSGIACTKIRNLNSANLTEHDYKMLSRSLTTVNKNKNLLIDQTASITYNQIKSKCQVINKKLEREGLQIDAIFVDYLQIMGGPEDTPYQKVTNICKNFEAFKKEFNCSVFLLSQFSRAFSHRPGNRPILPDLKESGQIEQTSDQVLFVHRPERHGEEGGPEIIVAKNRDGKLGSYEVGFEGETKNFYEGN